MKLPISIAGSCLDYINKDALLQIKLVIKEVSTLSFNLFFTISHREINTLGPRPAVQQIIACLKMLSQNQ